MKRKARQNGSSGFTLVEIALALLVVAIGLVVVVGLFPAGLKANKISIDETQMAMVADEILNGVKAIASETSWTQIQNTGFSLPSPAEVFWKSPSTIQVGPPSATLDPTRYPRTLTYNDVTDRDLVAYAYRYNLQLVPIAGAPNILGVKLQLWNGEQGPLTKGSAFYTEIYYNGNP